MTITLDFAHQNMAAIAQGTWNMGEKPHALASEIKALQAGLALGLNLIDTAEMYADGGSEKVVGMAIKDRREKAFVVSKVLPNHANKKMMRKACEASLERLQTDYIDLYLLHWPSQSPLEETFEAFLSLINAGKIRYYGVSNFTVSEMQALFTFDTERLCATNQVLYHLASRGIEYDLLPYMQKIDCPLMAYSPLAHNINMRQQQFNQPELIKIADQYQLTLEQLLLAWCIRQQNQKHTVMAIAKATQLGHVNANAQALDVVLSEETLHQLDQWFPPPQQQTPLDIL